MLNWLFPKKYLIATVGWTVNWVDAGTKESGTWMLFETKSGKRSFETTYIPSLLRRSGIPGYSKCKTWAYGGKLPDNAVVVKDDTE